MNQRERTHEGDPGHTPGAPTGGGNLTAIRQQATALQAAGDAAIDNVLSGDSTKFNLAAKQEGGQ
jgi:hypothetical protein